MYNSSRKNSWWAVSSAVVTCQYSPTLYVGASGATAFVFILIQLAPPFSWDVCLGKYCLDLFIFQSRLYAVCRNKDHPT